MTTPGSPHGQIQLCTVGRCVVLYTLHVNTETCELTELNECRSAQFYVLNVMFLMRKIKTFQREMQCFYYKNYTGVKLYEERPEMLKTGLEDTFI